MPDDEKQIRTLIEHWAEAVHSGDMGGVLALLRCGTRQELADYPENRLRLTLGLRGNTVDGSSPTSTTRFPTVGDDPPAPLVSASWRSSQQGVGMWGETTCHS
jgi:hypothetical protein